MTESARLIVTVDSTQVSKAATDLSALERSAQGAEQASSKLTNAAASAASATKGLGTSAASAAVGADRVESAAVSAALGLNDMASAASKAGKAGADLEQISRNAASAKSAVERLSASSQSLGGDMAKAGTSIAAVSRAIDGLDAIQSVDEHIANFSASVKDSKDTADEAADAFGKFRDSANDLQDVTPPTGSAVDNLTSAIKNLIVQAVAFVSVTEGLKKLSDVQREFDVLNAGLITATGSSEKAAVAFQALTDFADKTPYDMNQAVDGFTKLVNLGLTPSEKAMVSYGNTASAMSKDLSQMIEAVADATTGEFDRLKEFGIKAKQDGDKVTMVFQGVKTTIGNNAAEIEKYLIGLGENQFASAMALRMDTLDGKIANLAGSWDKLFKSVNDAGANNLMKSAVDAATDAVDDLTGAIASGQLQASLEASAALFEGFSRDAIASIKELKRWWYMAFSEEETGGLGHAASETVVFIADAFKSLPVNVRAMVQIMAVEVAAGLDKIAANASAVASHIKTVFTFGSDEEFSGVWKALESELAVANKAREDSIVSILEERDAALDSYKSQMQMAGLQRDMYEEGRTAAKHNTEDRLANFKKVSKAEKELTDEQKKSAKEAASLAERQKKALDDLVAQSALATASTNAMADAYLAGADNVRTLTIEQKIEEELLKTGAGARTKVTKAINDEADARDRLAIGELVAQMRTENDQTLDLAKATLQGEAAIDAYNVAKQVQTALIGKNIAVGSKEHEQLLDVTKAQLANNKALDQANRARGLVDRLNPEIAALREYREAQESLTWAMENDRENIDLYQKTLVKLGNEYEVNRSKATIWGQMTEAAVDRIDGVFADAWANIGDGAESLWDNLKKGFKQTLGEIMHMLTTKPLLASISNWLTGTDNGQGLSSVWGKLLGSEGGGGVGDFFSGSNLAGIGKGLYQAWNLITGVGAEAMAGYGSGGVLGAGQAILNYYGSMISTGFSSVVSAVTGSGAASVAAQGAATAAMNAGLAEMGTNIGVNLGVSLGEMGASAAADAGINAGAGAASAAGSSFSMWPLAIIMGMIQSGKLYDAGVRYDTSEMQTSKLSQVGRALPGMVGFDRALTFASIGFADRTMSKLFGDKAGAILSGSTLAFAVEQYIGEKLFGTGYQTKDQGLALSVENGEFEAQQYALQKKKKGLLGGSNKSRTLYADLSEEQSTGLQDLYDARIADVVSLFAALDVKMTGKELNNFNLEEFRVSGNMTDEQFQEYLTTFFNIAAHKALFEISEVTGAGVSGFDVEGLRAFVANLYGVNEVLKHVNVGLFEIGATGGFQAEQLSAMAGGFENLANAVSVYYDGFFTETEKTNNKLADINEAFKTANVVMPESRDGFRALVEGIDKSTEAGREMFITLMGLAPAAITAYDILESRIESLAAVAKQAEASAAAATLGNRQKYYDEFSTEAQRSRDTLAGVARQFAALNIEMPGTRNAFIAIAEGADRTTASGQRMYDTIMSLAGPADTAFDLIEKQLNAGVTDAFSALQRSVNAEKTALGDAYNARTASLNDMLSTASSSGSELSAIAGALESALKSLRGTSDDAVRMLRVQAQATLQTALATARSGGSLAGVVGLQDALDVASSMDEGLYSSLEEFEREQGRTANVIAELNVLNEGQLSTSETISLNIKKQLEQDKKAYDTEIAKLDETLLYWQTNIDALAGINNSVLGVGTAIGNMSSAFSSLSRYLSDAAVAANPNNGSTGITVPGTTTPITSPPVTQPGTTVPPLTSAYTGMAASVDLAFQALLGRTADRGSVDYWLGMITAGKVAPDGLIDAIRKDAIGNGEVPKFATGGLISGPGTGTSDSIMARVSAGEYVMRAAAVNALGTDLLDQLNTTGRMPVGETGPVLQVTRPSQIYSQQRSAAPQQSVEMAALIAEVRALREETRQNSQYIAPLIKATADHTDQIANGGVQVTGTVETRQIETS